jgi:TetR/AcrR family transcriptional regulator, cholesterol catabolism regulator
MATQQNRTTPREAILDVATRLFSETGYAGTTMRDIATAVGVLPGSLYAHIDGKETLLFEIIESGIDRFLSAAHAIDEIAGPGDKMRAAIKAHLGVVAESPERTLVVFHHWRYLTGKNRTRIIEKRKRYEEIFATLLDEGISAKAFDAQLDAKIAVLSILGSLNWSAEWLKPNGRAGTEEVGERLADTILHGLLAG